MKHIIHGKIPTWYDKECDFEEASYKDSANAIATNQLIEKILKKYNIKSVLDLTCMDSKKFSNV